jgi:hypothetical protein
MIRVSYQDDAKVGKEIDKPRPLFASSIDNYLELLVLPALPPPPTTSAVQTSTSFF